MTLKILDPITGKRITITVPAKHCSEHARHWVIRELDKLENLP